MLTLKVRDNQDVFLPSLEAENRTGNPDVEEAAGDETQGKG